MKIESNEMKRLIRSIIDLQPEEITCGECFDVVDEYVEMELAGKNASEALPLVKDHLKRCPPCQQEYQALYRALKIMAKKEDSEGQG